VKLSSSFCCGIGLQLFLLSSTEPLISSANAANAANATIEMVGRPTVTHGLPMASPTATPAGKIAVVGPHSLKDAFLAALHMSDTVEIQRELLVQAHEVDTQAFGAIFPTITGTGIFLTQADPQNATGNSLYPANQNTGKISLDQPLFRGLRDFAVLRQKKYLVDSQKFTIVNALKQLFYDCSTAYYNVLAYQQDELNYQTQIEISQKRAKELNEFYRIGRSQLTDVLTFKANISSLEAQLEVIRGQLAAAKDVLGYLTGWGRNMVLKDNEDLFSNIAPTLHVTLPNPKESPANDILAGPGDLDFYLKKIEERPDVKSAVESVQANEEGLPIAWGGHLPNVDLLGNYYFFRPGAALSSVNWDASINLTIPIFQGGIVQSQVRQAQSVARQYHVQLSQTRRLAEQEVKTFYDAVIADRQQVMKLTDLTEVSKKNFETETQYYRNGLVTNLDVLTSMTTYRDAVRQLDHTRYQFQVDGVKLQAATGLRSEVNEEIPKL
jgi:outer membrane protein